MELISIIIVFLVGFGLGFKFREYIAIRKVEKFNTEFSHNFAESYKANVVEIKVEDDNGIFYVYKKEDGSYLAHGESMSILEDILNEKFPGKLFNTTPEDLQKLKTR